MVFATVLPATASVNGNTISGNVFLDYNANGQRDNGEPGIAGVTASAFGPNNALLGSTTTDAAGNFTLSVGFNVTARVEVTGLPPGLRPGPHGPGSATTVFFATSPAPSVGVGLVSPADYCDAKPQLVVPCYTNGDPTMSCSSGFSAASGPALVSFPYFGPTGAPTPLATAGQIGATWGVAYRRSTGSLFASAMMRRHVGFGPSGTGAIYKIANPASGSPTITTWIDFNSPPHPTGADPHAGLTGCATDQNADPASFDAVGRISFGGLDLSPDESTLWIVNLTDRTAYSLDASTGALLHSFPLVPAFTSLYATGPVLCTNGELRPWAVRVRNDGLVFFGAVCSGENEPNPVSPTSADHLHAYVIALDPGSGTFQPIIDFPMDPAHYPKNTNDVCTLAGNRWWPWMSALPAFNNNPNHPGCGVFNRLSYPAPILSDIDFDSDGSLILGIMDRFGNQGDEGNLTPSGANTESFTGGGDTVRVCNRGGSFYLEGDPSGHCPQNMPNNGLGPNNGQFYFKKGAMGGADSDTTQGGLALLPGSGQVATTAGDVFRSSSGGVFWLNNTTGTPDSAYEVYHVSSSNGNANPGKANGLGDLALLCQPAPIEVGNRVWKDLDGNGVQDPGEPGIAGVTVILTCGSQTASTITNSAGEYYFNSQTNASGVLLPGTACDLKIDLAANASVLTGLVPTLRDYGSDLGNTDLDDSDGDPTLIPGFDVIRFTTGPAGYNDDSFDFGFQPPPGCLKFTPAVQCVTDGSGNVVLNFVFTNLFAGPIYNLFIANLPAGVTATPSYFHFSTPINTGGSAAVGPITLHGAPAGPLSFTITIHNQDLVLCCQQDVTIIVPACDCGEILGGTPFCPFFGAQLVSYMFQFLYLGVGTNPASHLLVIPEPPATFVVSPNDLILSPPLTYGQTSAPLLVGIAGTQPNQQVCLRISAADDAFRKCCSLLQCFPAPDCTFINFNPNSLRLHAGRFSVGVQWRDSQGRTGGGQAVALTDDTGYFWFFSPDNVELAVKVVDGRVLNGHWWLFYAGLSDVEYTLTLTDSATGSSRTYYNPPGTIASLGDTEAFAEKPAAASMPSPSSAPAAAGRNHAASSSTGTTASAALAPGAGVAAAQRRSGCAGDDTGLCLDQRFRVEVSWEDFQGSKGAGHAVSLSNDTGYHWFFDASNVELVVKILDGRALNGHWWVFYGALSNVRYTVTVTDTQTGASRIYTNPMGHFGSMADTAAF